MVHCYSIARQYLRYSISMLITFHRYSGTNTNCLNLGSYNYLGFAENLGPCAEAAKEATYKYGTAVSSARRDFGEKLCTITHTL